MTSNNTEGSVSFSTGSRVIISNIISRPEINGEAGSILRFDSETSRYIVELESSLEGLRIVPKNLTLLPKTKSIGLDRLNGILADLDGPRSGWDILSSEVESRERWPFYPEGVSAKNADLTSGWHEYENRINNGANGCAMVMATPHSSDVDYARLEAGQICKRGQPIRWLFPGERGKINVTNKRQVVELIAQFSDDEKHSAPWPLSDYTWHCPSCLKECLDGIFSVEGMVWMLPPSNHVTITTRFLPRLWCGTCYDEIRSAVRDKDTGGDCKYLINREKKGSPYNGEGTELLDLWDKYTWLKKEYTNLLGGALEDNVVKHNVVKTEEKDDGSDLFNDERTEALAAEQRKKAVKMGLAPLEKKPKNKAPKPSCEVCGKTPADLTCGSCTVTSYCSKTCQKVDWRKRGHNQTCSTLKAKMKHDAAHVLKMLWPPEGVVDEANQEASYGRVRWASDNLLDNGAAYSFACHDDLHGALRSFFEEDIRKMESRYSNDIPCSWTSMAVNSLFKKRSSNPSKFTSGADGEKCANYIASNNGAWPAWLNASIKLAQCVFLPIMRYNVQLAAHTQSDGRDAWAFLQLALIQRECAYAILVECRHVEETAASLREAILWIENKWQGDDSPDPNGTIAGCISTIAGMVHVWYDRFIEENILEGESFIAVLALRDGSAEKIKYSMYHQLAEATIDKGKFLDNAESNAIGRAWHARLGETEKRSNITADTKKSKKGMKKR